MGCCCSTSDDTSSIEDEPNVRTRLLQDPVTNYAINNSAHGYGNNYSNSVPQKSDDHSALYKILQDIVTKVIDVGALDCQTLEEHEYVDRARVYAQAINKLNIPQSLLKKKKTMLLMDVPSTERIPNAPPISYADFNMMETYTKKMSEAINSLAIIHKEDLVVPFGKG